MYFLHVLLHILKSMSTYYSTAPKYRQVHMYSLNNFFCNMYVTPDSPCPFKAFPEDNLTEYVTGPKINYPDFSF